MEKTFDNLELKDKELNPQEYFNLIKDRKHEITDEQLIKVYDNCLHLLNKYKITNQRKAMAKLIFHLECIEKEREIVSMGINRFVYRDDIEYYIDRIASDVVKIIEIENYEREIPNEIVNIVEKVSGLFDQLYVVFTDYTGKVEREVEKERRKKDPILFGTFQDTNSRTIIDRFYYLGDWVDEYCDLTLDKMVNEVKRANDDMMIEHVIKTPDDIEELKEQLRMLDEVDNKNHFTFSNKPKKKSFFDKIKTFFDKE